MINDKKYDLEERTTKFGEQSLLFAKKIPKNTVTVPLISQLVKSSTSIGANYCEADCAESRKDFEHKLGICKKESKETRHWLRMLGIAVPELVSDITPLLQEAHELQLIFISIIRKSKENSSQH